MPKYPPRDTYTPKIAAEICRRIANGQPLSHICGPDRPPGSPERVTVYNWLHRHPRFAQAYEIARLAKAELYIDQMIELASGPDDGFAPLPLPRGPRARARHWTTKT